MKAAQSAVSSTSTDASAVKAQKKPSPEESYRESRRSSRAVLFSKEMSDHLSSRRFIIIVLIILVTTIASIYGAMNGISDAIENDSNFIFLKYYTTSGNSIPSYTSFMALIGPFIGIMLGFDAINSERNDGTLNRLLAQPIYRDTVIIGKFLAGMALIAILVLSSGILTGAVGFLYIGIAPSGEEIMRLLIYFLYTIVYISFWLAMSMLFSVYSRHSATSALASIALWIFFAIFMSLIASVIANAVYPLNTQYQQLFNQLPNYNLQLSINRISPYYLYSEAISTILDPATRALNAVTYSQLVGALSGYLSLGQSLLLIWPHILAMFALTLAMFVIAYVGFMRQEVRGN